MHKNRKYPLDESFFEHIDTEEKAYWLGFIMADGYNNIKKKYVNIRLSLIDETHLLKFAEALKTTKPIRRVIAKAYKSDKYESCQLTIDSSKISKQLELLGVDGTKSKSLAFPKILPTDLYRHFIRGYFDGDGSISWNYKLCKATMCICSTTAFCQSLKDYFRSEYDIGGTIIYNNKKPNSCAQLHICGPRQIHFLLTWMYDSGSVFLNRKLEASNKIIKEIFKVKSRISHIPKKYEFELVRQKHNICNITR